MFTSRLIDINWPKIHILVLNSLLIMSAGIRGIKEVLVVILHVSSCYFSILSIHSLFLVEGMICCLIFTSWPVLQNVIWQTQTRLNIAVIRFLNNSHREREQRVLVQDLAANLACAAGGILQFCIFPFNYNFSLSFNLVFNGSTDGPSFTNQMQTEHTEKQMMLGHNFLS